MASRRERSPKRVVTQSARGPLLLAMLACSACHTPANSPQDATPVGPAQADLKDTLEPIYDGGFLGAWKDSGSAVRDSLPGGATRVRFDGGGEWVLTRAGLDGRFGAVAFRVKEPYGEGEFLEIHLESSDGRPRRRVKLKPDHRTDLADGWAQVIVPLAELNPEGAPFDRIVLKSFRPVAHEWTSFDKIALVKSTGAAAASPVKTPVTTPAVATGGERASRMRIACDSKGPAISPLIYGIAFGDEGWTALGATARRWGGNPMTRYNWETHFNNHAQDWFFENQTSSPYTAFLEESAVHGVSSALVVPTIGWVAKDGSSFSFPVSVFGAQAKTDPWKKDAGNGMTPGGTAIAPGDPSRTSVPAPPAWVARWVAAIRAHDAKTGKRGVYEYILDNEPMLWNSTHRDVHPEPVSYDELLDRTIQYATAIRQADHEAVIAGPAEWGWSSYFFSANDLAPGNPMHSDRLRHGNVPLVEWYLRKLRDSEQRTGTRLIDVLDLHYYPQAADVYGGGAGGVGRETQRLRLRSTRSLWDDTYVDESWIKEAVRLLPRMREWVDKNYPGLGISIGEWNFGGEHDITGALATAEALGRFAQFGVTSAFYWLAPPHDSQSRFGFLAFRNFDGKGGHFLDWYVPSTNAGGASLFASRDRDGKHIVAVVINMSPDSEMAADVDVSACGKIASQKAYRYSQGTSAFEALEPGEAGGDTVRQSLPPWSITTIDVVLQ